MSLALDARQRAMLQEMGVRVWWPGAPPQAPATPVGHVPTAPGPVAAPPGAAGADRAGQHTAPAPGAPDSSAAPATTATAAPSSASALAPVPDPGASPGGAWQLLSAQALFPGADPAQVPAGLGAGWLIVAEGQGSADPLAGHAGRLLENMLRALRLQRHPRVYLALLHPWAAPGGSHAQPAPCAAALAQAAAQLQPSVVLVMGRVAARAVLGRSEPLGRLRTEAFAVAGIPAVVTYDAPYLLRAPPETKALAWADLCRARALAARAQASAPPPGA